MNLWALRFLPLYYFLRGAAPKKIAQWKEPKAHRFNWCLEKRNGIFVLYPSSIYGIFQLLSTCFMSNILIFILTCTGHQYAAYTKKKCYAAARVVNHVNDIFVRL